MKTACEEAGIPLNQHYMSADLLVATDIVGIESCTEHQLVCAGYGHKLLISKEGVVDFRFRYRGWDVPSLIGATMFVEVPSPSEFYRWYFQEYGYHKNVTVTCMQQLTDEQLKTYMTSGETFAKRYLVQCLAHYTDPPDPLSRTQRSPESCGLKPWPNTTTG